MARFLVYRMEGKLGANTLETQKYVYISEEDVKVGRVNPRHNPLLSKEPEDTVEAMNIEEAERHFKERRGNSFH